MQWYRGAFVRHTKVGTRSCQWQVMQRPKYAREVASGKFSAWIWIWKTEGKEMDRLQE